MRNVSVCWIALLTGGLTRSQIVSDPNPTAMQNHSVDTLRELLVILSPDSELSRIDACHAVKLPH